MTFKDGCPDHAQEVVWLFVRYDLEAKLSDLKRHSTTKKHCDNARLIGQHRTLFSFTNMTLDSKVHGIKSWNCNLLTIFIQVSFAEALWANFTAEHNLSFALSDHATRLFSKMFPDSDIAKKFSSARTKTTAIVTNVLAPFLREKVVMSMKCRPFSLLFDEATDIGVVKSACMVIRIFDDEAGAVRSEFYNLIELGEKADAQTLFEAIESAFIQDGISFQNLLGFASDGANAMLGRHNSVKTRLLAKQPHLFVIHCICHVAALCMCFSCLQECYSQ